MEILNGKEIRIYEQNYTEDKAIHYIHSVTQCVKLIFT